MPAMLYMQTNHNLLGILVSCFSRQQFWKMYKIRSPQDFFMNDNQLKISLSKNNYSTYLITARNLTLSLICGVSAFTFTSTKFESIFPIDNEAITSVERKTLH